MNLTERLVLLHDAGQLFPGQLAMFEDLEGLQHGWLPESGAKSRECPSKLRPIR